MKKDTNQPWSELDERLTAIEDILETLFVILAHTEPRIGKAVLNKMEEALASHEAEFGQHRIKDHLLQRVAEALSRNL